MKKVLKTIYDYRVIVDELVDFSPEWEFCYPRNELLLLYHGMWHRQTPVRTWLEKHCKKVPQGDGIETRYLFPNQETKTEFLLRWG